jgi:hypothetical protein
MSPPRAWVLACLVGCGCAVDLLVDDGTGPAQASSSSGDDMGTTLAPSSSEGPGTSDDHEPVTTDDGTTVALDEGTSTGTSTEGPATEGTTTEGITTEGTTTAGEIPCPGLGYLDCSELPHCSWYGTPKMGECALSPCENPRHDCWTLPFGDCEAVFACAWVGEPRVGDCAPIECVPCELLGAEQCMEVPTCEWSELEELCLPA